jgi:putative transcriptional regulator
MNSMSLDKIRSSRKRRGYLEGQVLVAMPGMVDQRFARSVIYLCAHSREGAMGIVVNQRARRVKFSDLLVQLEVIDEREAILLPRRAGGMQVLKGGPVETQRGFVLHSSDYHVEDTTMPIDKTVSLTATVDILRAIAQGAGPCQAVLALGYAGWSPGQLEKEIQQNGWLSCEADADLVFGADLDAKYGLAMRKIGIDPAMLVSVAGHA